METTYRILRIEEQMYGCDEGSTVVLTADGTLKKA